MNWLSWFGFVQVSLDMESVNLGDYHGHQWISTSAGWLVLCHVPRRDKPVVNPFNHDY